MKLLRRIGWYLVGVAIGTILVLFIFGDREIGCSYFPTDRVLSDLSKKELKFSEKAECVHACIQANGDSTFVNRLLSASEIDFSYNKRGTDRNCNTYKLELEEPTGLYTVYIQNCKDTTATVGRIELPEGVNCDCPTVE